MARDLKQERMNETCTLSAQARRVRLAMRRAPDPYLQVRGSFDQCPRADLNPFYMASDLRFLLIISGLRLVDIPRCTRSILEIPLVLLREAPWAVQASQVAPQRLTALRPWLHPRFAVAARAASLSGEVASI